MNSGDHYSLVAISTEIFKIGLKHKIVQVISVFSLIGFFKNGEEFVQVIYACACLVF